MADYLVVKGSNWTKSYSVKTTHNSTPYLKINKTGYLDLNTVNNTVNGLRIQYSGITYSPQVSYTTSTSSQYTKGYSGISSSSYSYGYSGYSTDKVYGGGNVYYYTKTGRAVAPATHTANWQTTQYNTSPSYVALSSYSFTDAQGGSYTWATIFTNSARTESYTTYGGYYTSTAKGDLSYTTLLTSSSSYSTSSSDKGNMSSTTMITSTTSASTTSE